jgi:membrane protease YdiL (CAAX protease family)
MEPLVLYFVLFFPGIYASGFSFDLIQADIVSFSIVQELSRTLTYTIPSLVLLWYLISIKNSTIREKISFYRLKKIQKPDITAFFAGFPGLILIGFGSSLLFSLFSKDILSSSFKLDAPFTLIGWIILAFSCIGTGYLEESYFRFYLLTKLEQQIPNTIIRIGLSVILFSLCHIYEGILGIANSALAGLLLSVLFIRYKSLHGIAWAHGAYNIFVYFILSMV